MANDAVNRQSHGPSVASVRPRDSDRLAVLHDQRVDLAQIHRIHDAVGAGLPTSQSQLNDARSVVAAAFLSGRGIEVGAGPLPVPVPSGIEVLYGDIRDKESLTRYFGNEAADRSIIDARTFAGFANNSVDFVISAHVIEHLFDPIGSLEHAIRVLKPGGRYLLIVPDMRYTFDRNRPETQLDHLLADYNDRGEGTMAQAYREHLIYTHPVITGETVPENEFDIRIRDAIQQRLDVHVHAWTIEGFRQVLDAVSGMLGFNTLFQSLVFNEGIFALEKASR